MFFEIQYTIVDLRPLKGNREYDSSVIPQLESPYNIVKNRKEKLKFLRSIGGTTSRRNTGKLSIEGESFKCTAKRTFRFQIFAKHKFDLNNRISIIRDNCNVYKGFFRNTLGIVNRFQWGVNFNIESKEPICHFNEIIKYFLELPVEIPVKNNRASSNLQKSLMNIIERCTIRNNHPTLDKYIESTRPVIIFQLKSKELNNIDISERSVRIKEYRNVGIDLYKYEYAKHDFDCVIYFIVINNNLDNSTREFIRALRICLLRFFAEKECLINVFSNEKYIDDQKIKKYLDSRINNKQQIEMYTQLGLNNNCIMTADEEKFISEVGGKISNKKDTPFKIFT